MEALLRYLAWDLAGRGITANAVSPGATDDSVFSTLPPAVLDALRGWAGAGWVPMGAYDAGRRRRRRGPAVLRTGGVHHWPNPLRGWRGIARLGRLPDGVPAAAECRGAGSHPLAAGHFRETAAAGERPRCSRDDASGRPCNAA